MTLSLSSSFRLSPFFLLVFLEFYLVLKSFNGASRVFKVSRMFQVSLKGVYKKFQGSLKGVSRKLQECFKEVSGNFKGFSVKVFQVILKGVASI